MAEVFLKSLSIIKNEIKSIEVKAFISKTKTEKALSDFRNSIMQRLFRKIPLFYWKLFKKHERESIYFRNQNSGTLF